MCEKYIVCDLRTTFVLRVVSTSIEQRTVAIDATAERCDCAGAPHARTHLRRGQRHRRRPEPMSIPSDRRHNSTASGSSLDPEDLGKFQCQDRPRFHPCINPKSRPFRAVCRTVQQDDRHYDARGRIVAALTESSRRPYDPAPDLLMIAPHSMIIAIAGIEKVASGSHPPSTWRRRSHFASSVPLLVDLDPGRQRHAPSTCGTCRERPAPSPSLRCRWRTSSLRRRSKICASLRRDRAGGSWSKAGRRNGCALPAEGRSRGAPGRPVIRDRLSADARPAHGR